jgi:hypothetical protein
MINGSAPAGVCVVALGIALTVLPSFMSHKSPLKYVPPHKIPKPASVAFYPYESDQFTKFVSESYKVKGSGESQDFYSWFDAGFTSLAGVSPKDYFAMEKARIATIKDPTLRAAEEQRLGADIHHFVKKIIPKFSLQHGFEFYQAKDMGERQCFLQSVLVTGLLQRAGIDCGVVMVYKNIANQSTNNGHAVAVERLSNGKDVLVDCSDPTPNVEHKGLFMRDGEKDYIYVNPQYDGDSGIITAYRQEGMTSDLRPRDLATLDLAFIYSMFDYYRGERTQGGFFETPSTDAGLAESAAFLNKSVQENPRNPLAVYMLGHVYVKMKRQDAGMSQYLAAKDLYERDGWVPQGVVDALASR